MKELRISNVELMDGKLEISDIKSRLKEKGIDEGKKYNTYIDHNRNEYVFTQE